jgi:hypothetical protein
VDLRSDYEKVCEQYLLGELSEAAQAEVEQAYFADDSLFERFLAVKDDLIDAYSRGELKGEKLDRFEQHYLKSKARQQKVDESRALIQAASAASSVSKAAPVSEKHWLFNYFSIHPTAARIGLVAATLVLIALAWVVVTQYRSRTAPEAQRASDAKTVTDDKSASTNTPAPTSSLNIGGQSGSPSPTPQPELAVKPSPPMASTQIASVTLVPFSARDSGSSNVITIGPATRQVRINLVFNESSFGSFEATVRTVDGEQIVRQGDLKARSNGAARVVTLTFDSPLLRRQDFIATLKGQSRDGGLETISEYYFKVERTSNAVPRDE